MLKAIILFILLQFVQNICYSQKLGEDQLMLKLAKDTVRVNTLIELTKSIYTSEMDKAEEFATQALQLAEKLGYQKGMFHSYKYLAYFSRVRGDFAQDKLYLDKMVAIAKFEGKKDLLGEAYNSLFGRAFQQGDYNLAEEHLKKALEIAEELNDPRLLAKTYGNLARVLGIRGNHTKSVEYHLISMAEFRALGDSAQVAYALGRIGYTYLLAGSYGQAIKYLNQSLELQNKLNDKINIGWSLVNLGVSYNGMDKDTLALEYYFKSLQIAEETKDYRLILTNLDNIGGWYSLRSDFTKANEYLNRAYSLSEEIGQNSRTVYISGNLAENYLYSNNLAKAREFGEKQLKIALEQNIIYEQKTAYYTLSQIYAGQEEFKKAHQSLLGYIEVNDSIFNREKSEQIEELNTKYESEIKEQSITSLKNEKETMEAKRNLYAILAGSILIVGLLFFYMQRLKILKNRELFKKSIEVDRMKSSFFTNIAHEFRTPLTLILGPIESLMAKTDNPERLINYGTIKKNAGSLLNLVNQLLDLSKLEAGKFKLKVSQQDIVPILKGVVMSFQSNAEIKNIDLELLVENDECTCYFDREKLETILINLVSNALKFTPENGTIQISFKQDRSKYKSNIGVLEISDSGRGIQEKDLDHIFNRFYQAEEVWVSEFQGSGIGLALTKELVELHKGNITVFSQVGTGTRFRVQIPLDRERYHVDEIIEAPIKVYGKKEEHVLSFPKNGFPEAIKSKKPLLLLIEDNAEVRLYLSNIFKDDFQLVLAVDGEQGVERALEKIPDLIICDVMMPKKDGYWVCGILKKDERTSHIPIILLTAKADYEDKIVGLEANADDYVVKPFHPKELLLRVNNMIEAHKKLREKYKQQLLLKPSELTVDSVDGLFLEKLRQNVENNMANEHFGVTELGVAIGMSRSQLHRKITALLDKSPTLFIQSFRLQRAYDLLIQNNATASEISYQVGFGSPSYFTKCFHKQYGCTPSNLMKNSQNHQPD